MSKNFELLLQIEKTFGSASPVLEERKEEPTALPLPSPAALDRPALDGNGVDHEMARLVQRVFLPTNGTAHRRVVFCGIEAANTSTSVCIRAARTLGARTSEKVCLVDANPFRSELTGLFGISADHDGDGTTAEQCRLIAGNLWLATCNRTNGAGKGSAPDVRNLLAELQREFGYMLIDAPGCAVNEDATMLGQGSDALILVIEAETTHRQAAAKAKKSLEAAGVRLAGTVLNNRSFPIPQALYQRL